MGALRDYISSNFDVEGATEDDLLNLEKHLGEVVDKKHTKDPAYSPELVAAVQDDKGFFDKLGNQLELGVLDTERAAGNVAKHMLPEGAIDALDNLGESIGLPSNRDALGAQNEMAEELDVASNYSSDNPLANLTYGAARYVAPSALFPTGTIGRGALGAAANAAKIGGYSGVAARLAGEGAGFTALEGLAEDKAPSFEDFLHNTAAVAAFHAAGEGVRFGYNKKMGTEYKYWEEPTPDNYVSKELAAGEYDEKQGEFNAIKSGIDANVTNSSTIVGQAGDNIAARRAQEEAELGDILDRDGNALDNIVDRSEPLPQRDPLDSMLYKEGNPMDAIVDRQAAVRDGLTIPREEPREVDLFGNQEDMTQYGRTPFHDVAKDVREDDIMAATKDPNAEWNPLKPIDGEINTNEKFSFKDEGKDELSPNIEDAVSDAEFKKLFGNKEVKTLVDGEESMGTTQSHLEAPLKDVDGIGEPIETTVSDSLLLEQEYPIKSDRVQNLTQLGFLDSKDLKFKTTYGSEIKQGADHYSYITDKAGRELKAMGNDLNARLEAGKDNMYEADKADYDNAKRELGVLNKTLSTLQVLSKNCNQ